jgi:tRNA pseudouridine55 synthase
MAKGTQNINGILLLNKALGLSSNKALQQVKHHFDAKKAGHTGSLDPLASGMLPICFGDATKFSQYLLDADKVYEVVAHCGETTTTGDQEGDIVRSRQVQPFTESDIRHVLDQFTGTIQQIPPMYSALKHGGTPLYKLARQGVTIERKAREVTIYCIDFLGYSHEKLSLRVRCSKGTYIRTLVEDIGEVLGCGAHVHQLHRSMVSPFDHLAMVEWSALQAMSIEQCHALLLPVDSAVSTLPRFVLDDKQVHLLKTGQPLSLDTLQDGPGVIRLYDKNGCFMGVGKLSDTGQMASRRLLANEFV